MWREVCDVDAPHDGALDLCAALAVHLLGVGVLPEVVDVGGEPARSGEQRRCLCERAPAVQAVLGVEREVHTDVVTAVHRHCVLCPRCRDHQRCARCGSVAQCAVHTDVGGV